MSFLDQIVCDRSRVLVSQMRDANIHIQCKLDGQPRGWQQEADVPMSLRRLSSTTMRSDLRLLIHLEWLR